MIYFFRNLFFSIIALIPLISSASVIEDFASPLENNTSQKILLIGGLSSLLLALEKKPLVNKLQYDVHEDKPLCCRITQPGNAYMQLLPNALYSIGFGLHYFLTKDDLSQERAIGMTKASLYAGLTADIIKPIINETRPNGGRFSFPSGHTTTAFAFASFVASEHPWYYGVPAYVLASYVGFCRMQDNFHYLHDVLAGATIGISYGVALSQRSHPNSHSAAILTPTNDLKGLSLLYSLNF